MKQIVAVFLFMVWPFVLHSQSLDQLIQQMDTTTNPELVFSLYHQARKMSEDATDSLKALLNLNLGIAYGMKSISDSAIYYFDQAMVMAPKRATYLRARIYNGKGNVYRRTGDNKQSLENFQKALDLVEEAEDEKSQRFEASIINNLAGIYFNIGNLKKAREFTERSLEVSAALNDSAQMAYSYVGLGLIADNEGRWDDAIEAHKMADVLIEAGNANYLEGFNQLNLAEIYQRKGDMELARRNYQELIDDDRVNLEVVLSALENLADLWIQEKMPGKAVPLVQRSLELATQHDMLSHARASRELLFRSYEALENYRKANEHLKAYLVLNDSLINLESLNALNELEKKYETEKKQLEIESLAFQNEQKALRLEKQATQRTLFVVIIVGLALLLGILFWQYRQKIRFSQVVSQKNELITKTLNEREMLLKEIHHRVKNNLQVISSLLNLQSRFIKDANAVDAVQEGRNRVKSMALIHQKLYQEDNITGINIADYIHQLLAALKKSYKVDEEKVQTNIDVPSLNLDIDTAIPLGLILNELITNALKYAFPKDKNGVLTIRLREEDSALVLEVEDDGIGYKTTGTVEDSTSFGLTLIDSLAEKLQATVEKLEVQGTRYRILIRQYKLV